MPKSIPPPQSVTICANFEKDAMLFCQALTRRNPRDARAWDCLTKSLIRFVRNYASNWRVPEMVVDDIIQEALFRFVAHIDDGKYQCTGNKPISYVGTIATFLLKSWWKKAQKEEKLMVDPEDSFNEPISEDLTDQEECQEKAFTQAFNSLTPALQDIVDGMYFKHMSLSEYAEKAGMTYGSAKIKHHRAKEQFEKLFTIFYTSCIDGRTE